MLTPNQVLGRGLLQPLARDEKNDYANDGGLALVLSNVREILGTKVGEIRWRRAFGCRLHLLRHRPDHPGIDGLAAHFVVESLGRWEPRVRVQSVTRTPSERGTLALEVLVDIVIGGAVVTRSAPVPITLE